MSRLEEGTMSSADSESDKPTATIGTGKRFPRKRIAIIACVIVSVGIAAMGAYILSRPDESSEAEMIKRVNEYIESQQPAPSNPSLEEQYQTAKSALGSKSQYTTEDIGPLAQAAITAKAAKKMTEAKQYANEALVLIKQDKSYAEAYPQIVVQLQEIAK